MRFPLEIFDAVRAVVPADKPVGIKVSASDWVEGGWDLDQTIAFAKVLKQRKVDWIDVSSGGASPAQKIPLGPGYQVPFAEAIRAATGTHDHLSRPDHRRETGGGDRLQRPGRHGGAGSRPCSTTRAGGWHAAAELGGTVDAPPRHIGALRRTSIKTCSGGRSSAGAEERPSTIREKTHSPPDGYGIFAFCRNNTIA
ncbi:MAG: hypothetical protein WDN69_28875 [Aliidongia sp.]